MSNHQPVLVKEALEGLAVIQDGWYVDGTYGRGGHSARILAQLGENGRLLALDKDPEAYTRRLSQHLQTEADVFQPIEAHGAIAFLGRCVGGAAPQSRVQRTEHLPPVPTPRPSGAGRRRCVFVEFFVERLDSPVARIARQNAAQEPASEARRRKRTTGVCAHLAPSSRPFHSRSRTALDCSSTSQPLLLSLK